jgi:hypothetical protein
MTSSAPPKKALSDLTVPPDVCTWQSRTSHELQLALGVRAGAFSRGDLQDHLDLFCKGSEVLWFEAVTLCGSRFPASIIVELGSSSASTTSRTVGRYVRQAASLPEAIAIALAARSTGFSGTSMVGTLAWQRLRPSMVQRRLCHEVA